MFQVVNQKSIGAFNTIFGPSIKAVLTLSSKTAEMASILPTIIGASADSRNVNFQDLVLKHLKNSTVEVPAQGYELETGWEFSLNDPVKRDAILDWAKKNSINTEVAPNKLEKAIFDAMLFGEGTAVHEENLLSRKIIFFGVLLYLLLLLLINRKMLRNLLIFGFTYIALKMLSV